jgi:hypothetical protein
VAFVGGGAGFRFSAGVGVGWFPLAPGEVYLPGYRVSRTYVNNINVTNTTVNVTKVTNVYNTVIINKSTTINNITYVNQRVNNGVTVVSHDAFVNARPVAQNVMRVEPREIAAAPVGHAVAAEPVRASVVGAGRPAPVKPPATVISRPVVAVRTPPPPLRPIEQRQTQAGGHLNQQLLVHPMAPARPAPVNAGGRPAPTQDGFRPFGQTNPNPGTPSGNTNGLVKPTLKPQPRVYEQQGSLEENRSVPENRNVSPSQNRNPQPSQNYRPPQQPERPSPPQESYPLVRPAPPVHQRSAEQEQQQEQKFNQWHEQRPAPPPPQPRAQPQPRPAPSSRPEPPKKGH